ncbi:ribosomal protein subunit Mrp17 [Schizosaccharomyces cryophilus OY26]|uniref:Ribosomal protein subunit Mrp17 n=1 Tax=Schizosaccharomyces cryophilus (strain OY26 / ATCC MYA-4695 / CBS 11777 / NBRC 106824 / NRRL Y48691) TaxID=653667 RepID=S9X7F4_SCHCR|nr:ribosomal protein subunit Mrp17 [Schizosaccharomyces cryophilus OY26]EPY49706.1 ribosomal protein subunit Mrp17 [Schizosaccharomyces cryophilus OY26]
MVLYELFCITRPAINATRTSAPTSAINVARNCGKAVLDSKGVVVDIESMGLKELAKPVKKLNNKHNFGYWWSMSFYSSPTVQQELQRILRLEPTVLRYTFLKKSDKLNHLG